MKSIGSAPVTLFRRLIALSLMLLLPVALAGCDSGGGGTNGDDQTPSVENQIQDRDANAGGEVIEVDLSTVFSAPANTSLAYSASSSNTAVAEVSVSDEVLTVTPGEGGEAEISVTAANEAGEATARFTVTVFAGPPGRPD